MFKNMIIFFLIVLCVWGCSNKSDLQLSDSVSVASISMDSIGYLHVMRYEVDQENQSFTRSSGVVTPSVTLFNVDGKLVSKEEYVEFFNRCSKQGKIEFMGQDTICFYCSTKERLYKN